MTLADKTVDEVLSRAPIDGSRTAYLQEQSQFFARMSSDYVSLGNTERADVSAEVSARLAAELRRDGGKR